MGPQKNHLKLFQKDEKQKNGQMHRQSQTGPHIRVCN